MQCFHIFWCNIDCTKTRMVIYLSSHRQGCGLTLSHYLNLFIWILILQKTLFIYISSKCVIIGFLSWKGSEDSTEVWIFWNCSYLTLECKYLCIFSCFSQITYFTAKLFYISGWYVDIVTSLYYYSFLKSPYFDFNDF